MATLGYKPSASAHEGGDYDALRPGRYSFKVDDVGEKVFGTGNEGLSVKLLVLYEGRDVPCFVNLVYTDKAAWRLKQFLDSIGLDYDNPPELREIYSKQGVADFKINDKGYFEVKTFLDPVEQTKHKLSSSSRPSPKAPLVGVGDDAPF